MADTDSNAPPAGAFLDHQIGHLLRRAYGIARNNSAAALAALGDVSPIQAAAIALLGGGPLSQAELGRRIDMEPANTHTLVRRLAAAGLVDVQVDPANRRRSLIALTPTGRTIADRVEPLLAEGAHTTLAPLPPADQAKLLALLARIVTAD